MPLVVMYKLIKTDYYVRCIKYWFNVGIPRWPDLYTHNTYVSIKIDNMHIFRGNCTVHEIVSESYWEGFRRGLILPRPDAC